MGPKIRPYLLLILPFLLVLGFSYYLQGLILTNQEDVTKWLSNFGPFVILVYILLQIITVVLAPIGGFFLQITLIALFGPGIALTLSYLVVTPTYLLNFYLAKKYGRPLVEKIIGKTSMGKIDHYVQDLGTFTLVVLRVFQGGSFDYLSYGIGLTKTPFKTFAIVNFLAGIPGTILTYFIFTKAENLTSALLTFYAVTVLLAAVPLYLHHHRNKHKK